jgi:hypothetical protein
MVRSFILLFRKPIHKIKQLFSELWMPHIDTLNEDLSPTKEEERKR